MGYIAVRISLRRTDFA